MQMLFDVTARSRPISRPQARPCVQPEEQPHIHDPEAIIVTDSKGLYDSTINGLPSDDR